jgi:hypothetical protein
MYMMNHSRVIKRAWQILWRYRALWVFGFLLALTTASYGSINFNFNLGQSDLGRPFFRNTLPEDYVFPQELDHAFEELNKLFSEGIPSDITHTLINIGIILILLIILLVIVGKILRYISETALIRMIDEYEQLEKLRSVKYGFRLGWSRTAWRLFLIDLVIDLPVVLIFLLLLALVLAPILLWAFGKGTLDAIGIIATIGFFFLFVLAGIIVNVALGLMKPFFRRASALKELRVIESIRNGYLLVRCNFKDVGIMWLILFGINIGWSILTIPLKLLFFLIGIFVGGTAAITAGLLTGISFGGMTPWIFAAAVGFPIFLATTVFPVAFVNGLRETFISTTWTITYREITQLEHMERIETQDPNLPEVEAKSS